MNPSVPVIALVGRPNVGKSTLFNRLTRSRDALVANIPGLTRDRHYGSATLVGQRVVLIDTGGFEPVAATGVAEQMARQTRQAVIEADVVVFVVDGRQGLLAQGTQGLRVMRGLHGGGVRGSGGVVQDGFLHRGLSPSGTPARLGRQAPARARILREGPGPAGIPVPGRPVGLRSQAGAIPRGFHTRTGPCGGNERAYATQSRLNTRITLLGC